MINIAPYEIGLANILFKADSVDGASFFRD